MVEFSFEKDKYRQAIIEVLSANPRVDRAVIFGSRAMATFTTTSDVDIVLYGDELTLTDQARLIEAIDELPVPQRVDLLLHKSIKNKNLLKHIKKYFKRELQEDNISPWSSYYSTSFVNGR